MGFASPKMGNDKLVNGDCMQAMPQLTDRSKVPDIVDPAIKNAMDLKHLYQVCQRNVASQKHGAVIFIVLGL